MLKQLRLLKKGTDVGFTVALVSSITRHSHVFAVGPKISLHFSCLRFFFFLLFVLQKNLLRLQSKVIRQLYCIMCCRYSIQKYSSPETKCAQKPAIVFVLITLFTFGFTLIFQTFIYIAVTATASRSISSQPDSRFALHGEYVSIFQKLSRTDHLALTHPLRESLGRPIEAAGQRLVGGRCVRVAAGGRPRGIGGQI